MPSDTDGFLKRAVEPSDGGAGDQEIVDGRPMSLDFLQSIDEAFRIRDGWRDSGRTGTPRVIVELGAGYGRLAYVCRKMMPDCTYVILDLSEALACSTSWLGQVLPGELVPYRESRTMAKLDRETLQSRKVWTLGAQQIEQIEPHSADAFVNVYSFAEMPPASITNYFAHIERIADGIFYSKQRKVERNVVDDVVIAGDSYPVRPHWRELFRQTSTLYEAFFEVLYDLNPAAAPRV